MNIVTMNNLDSNFQTSASNSEIEFCSIRVVDKENQKEITFSLTLAAYKELHSQMAKVINYVEAINNSKKESFLQRFWSNINYGW